MSSSPALTARPSAGSDRAGLLGGLALGGVMLLIAVVVAISGEPTTGPPTGASAAVLDGGTQTVAVQLTSMRITPAIVEITAGTKLILDVANTDAMAHDLLIDGGPGTPMLEPRGSARLDLGAIRRTTAGWCTVPGHRAAGMTMTIKVIEGR